jgi:hypothetical protein
MSAKSCRNGFCVVALAITSGHAEEKALGPHALASEQERREDTVRWELSAIS